MSYHRAFEKAEPLIARALELDEYSSDAQVSMGNPALQYHVDFGGAEKEFLKASSKLALSRWIDAAKILAMLGRKEESRRILKDIVPRMEGEYYSLADLAKVHLALGDRGKALDLLEESFNVIPTSFLFHLQDPDFDCLREDSRFLSLERKLALPKKIMK